MTCDSETGELLENVAAFLHLVECWRGSSDYIRAKADELRGQIFQVGVIRFERLEPEISVDESLSETDSSERRTGNENA
jgi:hypothetical protein